MKHSPLPLEKIKSLHKSVTPPSRELKSTEKLALFVTEKIGTMGFFFIIFLWTVLWMFWNILAPAELRFDKVPAFELWLFISNMIQLFLLPLLLIGQNLQNRYSEMRAEQDFEINRKAEREVETVLEHLENQNEALEKMLDALTKNK